MKIIVINGQAGVGKDLFVKYCQKYAPNVHNLSIIDYVKQVATYIGWNKKKDEQGRKLLSDLKDILTDYNDIPFEKVVFKINTILTSYQRFGQSFDKVIFFIHCREPRDIEKFCKQFNAKSLLIRRPSVEKHHENHADNDVFDYDYDFTYLNEFEKDRMENDVKAFIEWVAIQPWESGGEGIIKENSNEVCY